MGQCLSATTKQDDGVTNLKAEAAHISAQEAAPVASSAVGIPQESSAQPAHSAQHQRPQLQEQQPPPNHQPQQQQQQQHQQQSHPPQHHHHHHQQQQQPPLARQQDAPSLHTEARQQTSNSSGNGAIEKADAPQTSSSLDAGGLGGHTSTSSNSSHVHPPGATLQPQGSLSGRRATVELLRAQKSQRLRDRRSLTNSFKSLQLAVSSDVIPMPVHTRAAGLKHIGFGPFKRENQDEFFIQVGDFGGADGANLFCVFDGHGTYGKDAAAYSRQQLPVLLDAEMRKYFQKVSNPEDGLKGAVEVLLSEVFGETERSLQKAGINISSSGTTASVAYQKDNRMWVASAGDSRVILCCKDKDQAWRVQALTIDHRPRRPSERARVEASGGRVAPKRLPSGRTVGEPRLWLADLPSPGLLLSRSLGDMTAATVGCTSDPEITYLTLRPDMDCFMVLASDGVWDVLTNDQVCEIVVASPDPHIACRRVLDAALFEWEERMSADNITVVVAEFDWSGDSKGAAEDRGLGENGNGGSHKLADEGLESDDDKDADAGQSLPATRQRRQLRGR